MTKHLMNKFKTETAIPLNLETKDGSGHGGTGDVGKEMDKFLGVFEEFKSTNDKRLKEIEAKGYADPLLEEKTNKINTALIGLTDGMKDMQAKSDLEKKRNDDLESEILALKRSPQGGSDEINPAQVEYKTAYNKFMRGHISEDEMKAAERKAIEQKAMSAGSDADGGFVVPEIVEKNIYKKVEAEHSAFRRFCKVQTISTSTLKKIIQLGGVTSGWVDEMEARPDTDTPQLTNIIFNTNEIYAQPIATQTFIDDSAVNVDTWLANEVAMEFAFQETQAFVLGDGNKKPMGILAQPKVADNAWAWGKIGVLKSGHASTLGDVPIDGLIDLITAPKKKYRTKSSRILANKLTIAEYRKLKDGNGNYIWSMGDISKGVPDMMLGYGVEEIDEMPDIAPGSTPLAFGDFKRGYLILDRIGIRVLRDPYTNKPNVKFYTTKRVGGGVMDFEAYKLLEIGA